MEKLMAVVFSKESNVLEGLRELNQLDAEGIVTVFATQMIQKNADGKVSAQQIADSPLHNAKGFWMCSLIKLLGGPAGIGSGAGVVSYAGAIGDLNIADVNIDFVTEVSAALAAGKSALLVDISEEWVTPVDARMEAVGGVAFRTPRKHFEAEYRAREAAMLRAEIGALKAEHGKSQADRKAKLEAKMEGLNKKLERKLEEARQRSFQMKAENEAKIQDLQEKASRATGDAKTAMEARITQLRKEYDQVAARLKAIAA
jgi:uncharacterized membrane protein